MIDKAFEINTPFIHQHCLNLVKGQADANIDFTPDVNSVR